MLLKHVYMGHKFQRTLKLSMSFSLKHFFISVAIITQVASALLRKVIKLTNIYETFKEHVFSVWPQDMFNSAYSLCYIFP